VKKLVDFDAAAFRMRVGNYRVLFDREDDLKVIDIIDILQRKTGVSKEVAMLEHVQIIEEHGQANLQSLILKNICQLKHCYQNLRN